jgi:hypothetical protein
MNGQPIAARQNKPDLIRLLAAAHWYYARAQAWHMLRVSGTIGFVLVGVLVTLRFHGATDYVAAAASAWLLLSRTLFEWRERSGIERGALIQEQWDTTLFGLAWNAELVGRHPTPEDVAEASSRIKGKRRARLHDWYSRRVDAAPWPTSVLLCQRSSVVWGRRRHTTQWAVIALAAASWLVATVIIGVATSISLADYLLRLFLPSMPAMVDAADLARAHHDIARRKQKIERSSDDLLERARATGAIDADACRRLQDQIFELRRRPPRISWAVYRFRRDQDNAAMDDAVDDLLRRLGFASEASTLSAATDG